MKKSQVTPTRHAFRLIPSSGARRADEHTLQFFHHRVAIETSFSDRVQCDLKKVVTDFFL
jgi:hypothetical protein